jgi:transcriptional regulator with XRE-family HTH domain
LRVRELGRFIREQRASARLSLRKLSSLAGISNPYLSQIERGLRRPSAEILQAIAKALRISAETLYVKAGILEERTDTVDIGSTIRRDTTLNQQQKKILLDLYQSFHAGDAAKPKRAAKKTVRKVAAAKKPSSRSASRGGSAKTRKPAVRRRARRTA